MKINVSLEALEQEAVKAFATGKWWSGQQYPPETAVNKCNSEVANQLVCCAVESKKIHEAMGKLIDNTVAFCKTVKINFEKADQT